jgi:hypothetical protein
MKPKMMNQTLSARRTAISSGDGQRVAAEYRRKRAFTTERFENKTMLSDQLNTLFTDKNSRFRLCS